MRTEFWMALRCAGGSDLKSEADWEPVDLLQGGGDVMEWGGVLVMMQISQISNKCVCGGAVLSSYWESLVSGSSRWYPNLVEMRTLKA